MRNGYSKFLLVSWIVAGVLSVLLWAWSAKLASLTSWSGSPGPYAAPAMLGWALAVAGYAVIAFVGWLAVRAIAGMLASAVAGQWTEAAERIDA